VDALNDTIQGILDDLTAADPPLATTLGLTMGMERLPSYSPASVRAFLAAVKAREAALEPLLAQDQDVGRAVDAFIGVQMVRRVVRDFELRAVHRRRPSLYMDTIATALLMPMLKDMAPLDDRLTAVEKRLQAIPGFLEEARANLAPTLPPVAIESAVEFAGALQDLVTDTAKRFARDAGHEGMFDAVSVAAAQSLAGYRDHLNDVLLPMAAGDGAAGRDVLEDILRHEHVLKETPEQIAAAGRRMMDETAAAMADLAAEMGFDDARSAVAAVQADHPRADDVVQAYSRAVDEARRYVVDHDLVTLPEGEELQVSATPSFLRPVLPFAAYEAPGPYEARQRGFYWVTPPPDGMSSEKLDEAMMSHPNASLSTVGVHEGYPGHHVQLTRANRAPTLARRLAGLPMGGTLLVEGWAFYCEEMMEHQGFLSSPEVRLMRLNDQIWRACRVILDMELHLGTMGFAEAVDMLERTAHMGHYEAVLECRRYLEEPGQPMSYLIGKREVVDLARDYARQRTTSLKAFHDALLEWGSLSPSVIRWGMGLGPRPF
jgi:uncharacterized protein (DUF885 family)